MLVQFGPPGTLYVFVLVSEQIWAKAEAGQEQGLGAMLQLILALSPER